MMMRIVMVMLMQQRRKNEQIHINTRIKHSKEFIERHLARGLVSQQHRGLVSQEHRGDAHQHPH
jgi:hypothetical protein